MYEQRDVVLMPFPYTDLTRAKKRPAVVLSKNNDFDVICCLVTSKETQEGILLDKLEGTLPLTSWVKPHRIFAIDKRIILKRLCKVQPEMHSLILQKLNEEIALSDI